MSDHQITTALRLSKKEMAKKKKKRRHFDDGGDVRGDSLSRSELASMDRDYSAPSRGETVNAYTRGASETTDTSDRRGGREDYTPVSPTVDQTVAELNRQAMDTSGFGEDRPLPSMRSIEDTSMQKLANVMATSPSQLMSDKMLRSALDLSARNQAIIDAQKEENARQQNIATLRDLGALRDTRPSEYQMADIMSQQAKSRTDTPQANLAEAQAQAAIDAASMRAGPVTGMPRDVTGPLRGYEGGAGEFETQPEIPAISQALAIAKAAETSVPSAAAVSDTSRLIGAGRGISGPTAEQIKAAQVQNVPSTITSYRTGTEPGPYDLAGAEAAKQRQDAIAAELNQAAQQTGAYRLPSEPGYHAGTDLGPYDATLAAANIAKQIMAKQETGAAAPVPAARVPSPSARVPLPPIPYRDLGAGSFADKFMKLFGMDTESWINRKAADYEKQGMSPSDAAIQASYDLRDIQLSNRDPERRQLYGADAATRAADKAVLEAMMKPKTETTAVDTTKTPTTDVTPKLPEIGEPYVPTGQLPYVPSGQGYSTGYLDLGASASIARQAAYNQAVQNALRLLKLA